MNAFGLGIRDHLAMRIMAVDGILDAIEEACWLLCKAGHSIRPLPGHLINVASQSNLIILCQVWVKCYIWGDSGKET
jgi:hypothetical protein